MDQSTARVQRSRKKLADALISLSLEQGYENITIAAVTERARVSHSTIYRHYKSLDDLLLRILRVALQQTEARISQHLSLYDEAVALYGCVKEYRKLFRIYAELPPTNRVRQVFSAEFAKLIEARCEQRAQMQAPVAVSAEQASDASATPAATSSETRKNCVSASVCVTGLPTSCHERPSAPAAIE